MEEPGTEGLQRELKDSWLGMAEGALKRRWCLQWVENSEGDNEEGPVDGAYSGSKSWR